MIILYWLIPWGLASSWILLVFGVGLMMLGIVIAVGAESQFRRSRTTVDHLGIPTKLVTDGWFRYSRNPMYLSFALLLMGAWLALGSVAPLFGVVAYLFLVERWYIAPEEKRLVATFGKQYESYRMRARRWL